ncbi:hypothetical protein EV368DRAFT_81319 [Lentinula lateritia]|nr:hypothetical protein EV368DRAFT_81319 [Lentinula lateritia]
MENSDVLSDVEVNKDPQNLDLSEDLDDSSTLFQLLSAVPSFGGANLDWPLPFPFTTWEEALGLNNLLESQQFLEPDWEALEASIAHANCDEVLPQVNVYTSYSCYHIAPTPGSQNTAPSQPDPILSLYHQADWYAAMASPVDWNALLSPQAHDTAANGDTAQISCLPGGPSINDVQAECPSSLDISADIKVVSNASQFSLPTSSEEGNECYDDISSGATETTSLVQLAVPASTTRLARLAPPTNNTEQLLSQFPQAIRSSDSHSQPHRSSRSHKSKPYAISTERSKSPDSEVEVIDTVVVQVKDFEDLCGLWNINPKDLKFLLERDHPCYDRYKNYCAMRDFLVPLGFTKDKTWKALTRMGVYYAKSETHRSESLADILNRCKWKDRTWDDKRQYYSWVEEAPNYIWNDVYPRSDILEGTEYIKDGANLYNHFIRIKFAFDKPGYFNLNLRPRKSGGDYYETRTAELAQESIKRAQASVSSYQGPITVVPSPSAQALVSSYQEPITVHLPAPKL